MQAFVPTGWGLRRCGTPPRDPDRIWLVSQHLRLDADLTNLTDIQYRYHGSGVGAPPGIGLVVSAVG